MNGFRRTLVIVACLLGALVEAASETMLFKLLDTRSGLNSSQINCVLKDSRGFVWIGTPAGLYRYDGYSFKSYQSSSQDGFSLPNSFIVGIQESLDGNLWIQTSSGTCIYNPATDTFERDMRLVYSKMGVKSVPDIVFVDSNKTLWMYIKGTGVLAYDMQHQLMYEFGYSDDARGLPEGTVVSMSECRDGAILVYDNGRLVCCSAGEKHQTVWQANGVADAGLRTSETLRAFADQKDNVWLYGHGTLMVYNKSTDTWDTAIGNAIGMTGVSVDRSVNGMAGDSAGNIWIGTDEYGLIRMNVESRDMELVEPKRPDGTVRQGERTPVQSVYVDDTGLLWVGTERSGVALGGKDLYKFVSERIGDITAIAQESGGRIWYGTADKGVIGYDGPLASMKVTALACTPDGSLWVGSKRGGLTRIKDGKATFYSVARDSMRTLIHDAVNALCTDKSGNLWIATAGGLQVYNPRMNTFSAYTRENGKLTTNIVTSLFYGNGNTLLVGTNEGVMVQNLSTNERTLLTGETKGEKKFTNNYITQLMEDSRGLLWIGTREGINIYDRESDRLDCLTEKNGLAGNSVCGLAEDKYHNIWVTTGNGVTRIAVQRNHEAGSFNYGIYNYTTSDGLLGNEFNTGAILASADGNIILGGLYGVSRIRQTETTKKSALPPVMFTGLFIDDEEIAPGRDYDGRVLLPQSLNESKAIDIPAGTETFTITFAAGDYSLSERLMFMYWMEGADDSWKNADPLTHGVTFANLSSGKYTLHVKAISADGAVSDVERTLGITVPYPWWMAWWMIIIYVILLAAAVYAVLFVVRRTAYFLRKKKAVINALSLQRDEVKAASDDLRAPMSRMTSIISDMAEKKTSAEEREQINSMHFQILQIITRISEMQTMLENPVAKAEEAVAGKLSMGKSGAFEMPKDADDDDLTYEMTPRRADSLTLNYTLMFVDDNPDFLKFISAHLRNVYNVKLCNSTENALSEIDVTHVDMVVCKQEMAGMTGSELCNKIKTNRRTENVKVVIMTAGVLSPAEMQNAGITLAADDYLSKPFNVQETIMRFNQLLGLAPTEGLVDKLIEGSETRRLEGRNASMTTASFSKDETGGATSHDEADNGGNDNSDNGGDNTDDGEDNPGGGEGSATGGEDYSMLSGTDRQFLKNIEQYVLHNMSRGTISLEEMSAAMGMGKVPFFRKVRSITSKTPAEYVRELKLKHACTLLVRTNVSMNELAINLGFMTAENFIAVFKEKYGISPVEYRQQNRREE